MTTAEPGPPDASGDGVRRATVAWFHCFSGIAGDMALGSLIDAGADTQEIVSLLRRIPIDGWAIEPQPVLRNGIAATQAGVRTTHDTAVVRTYAHICGLLEEARLPSRVLARALATFGCLAEAEGRLHRRPPSQVHFHEVGGVDAIVDIVGTCAALEILGVERVTASPVATGIGMVRSAHGLLPNPAPAVVELLRGAPTYGVELAVELTTPTGAALLAALSSGYGPMPRMTIELCGFGAGSRELDTLPNMTQVVIGESSSEVAPAGQVLTLIETNLDDITGEALAHALEAALAAGALDAWITPVVMKKGRPAHLLSALCDPVLAPQVSSVIRAETGTGGVRGTTVERWPVPRISATVEVDGAPLRIKVSPGRVKVEHDDAARLARRTGLPLREVARRAEAAWHRDHEEGERHPPAPDPPGPIPFPPRPDGDTA